MKIAIIDTGLDLSDPRFKDVLCLSGHRDFTHTTMTDDLGHGTHIAGIIKSGIGTSPYCLLIYKFFHGYEDSDNQNIKAEIDSIDAARLEGAKFINLSEEGPQPDSTEYAALKAAAGEGITIVVAAGNEGHDISVVRYKRYPASYDVPGMVVVGNLLPDGVTRQQNSGWGKLVTAWEIGTDIMSTMPGKDCVEQPKYAPCQGMMTGSSQATAVRTAKLVKAALARH